MPAQGPPSYLPQPSSTGSVDLSAIKPINQGSVSIAEAIAKAKSIAADRGYEPRQAQGGYHDMNSPALSGRPVLTNYETAPPREDPRLAGRERFRSRSRSPPRRDAYNANPYRDERREDRRGGFGRSPSPPRQTRGMRDPPFKGGDGDTETIRVKSALVGLIIGRQGENLRKVESETGARVQFIQAKDSHAVERQCTISGSLRSREAAKAAIYAIIDENGGSNLPQEKGGYSAGAGGRAKVNLPALREGENSTQIMVPDRTVGLIIGRGGETIRDLQERSGCHVNIVGENKSVNGLRPVNLIGSEQATAMAKELILEIVDSDQKAQSGQGGQQGQAPPRDAGRGGGYDGFRGGGGDRDHIDKTIMVPSEAVGMIIGKGGETIKDMQRSTGCKINVNQPHSPDFERAIDLSGPRPAAEEAERIIWEKVETVRQRDAAAGRPLKGGQGGQGGRGGGQDYGQPQGYSQAQQPAYGGYAPPQPQFQMPGAPAPTQQAPASDPNDPYAAYGGLQNYLALYYANLQAQQQGGQGGAPPGAQ